MFGPGQHNQPNAARWQTAAPPVGPAVTAPARPRNDFQPPLIDTISPGRTLPFGCTLLPVPTTAEIAGVAAPLHRFTAYFTLARFRAGENLPEGAVLGFRLDAMSLMAEGGDPGAGDITGRIFGAAGTPPATPTYFAAQTQYGAGAAFIIATGNRYRSEFADTPGTWRVQQSRFPTIAQGPPYFGASPTLEQAYIVRPPNGDLCGTVTAVQRMTTTNRDQPFGARITPNDDIYVIVAVSGTFAHPAAVSGSTNKYFPCVMNGEIFVTPALDDRRIRDV